ncbi:hypothetical protein Dshi_2746 [Dinoroseobacter shibae DFL 12 = DSM 16493]|jgi:hypothetical protein|uniref:Uncharacterized protein n=1 Tax=Dinoroseobacter shibae (strain DSM 16493 / NCIMB 14021 / DFL 12) TaxID=398580 RepID=A8LIN8_DINSH|nr:MULTISPECIES: hypothetical protein [Dinoroseobacter]ABV94479.1 hypothetical protein Dshi_2746 [Dinoroseobacter shibae DFL 12 = DSM 16493]MDD9717084.1 hypothetical protein [Dinoroseobacter sp. PD6]URF45904.1 hypothetical protein M8008_14145 [Dinoroseobacter shibae]URF50210.1 hypothetical protein M8007_14145 [Dinoroseobacter shibae]
MSNLEDRKLALSENPYAEKYAAARASIEAEKRSKEASGYAWMSAAMNYGAAAEGPGRFGKISSGAKWFCIWFAMIVPNLLFIRVLL